MSLFKRKYKYHLQLFIERTVGTNLTVHLYQDTPDIPYEWKQFLLWFSKSHAEETYFLSAQTAGGVFRRSAIKDMFYLVNNTESDDKIGRY